MYYLVARPQTLVSMVNFGRLPETLPHWYEPKQLIVYHDPKQAIENSKANKASEIFLLELSDISPDRPSATGAGSDLALLDTEPFPVPNIDAKKIQKVIFNSKAGERLFTRLLNDDFLIPTEINPTYFSDFEEKTTLAPLDAPVTELASSFTLPAGLSNKRGDIMESRAQTLVNPVNCVGIMGKGLAFIFKQNYPKMFDDYKQRCDSKSVKLGLPYLYKVSPARWIVNFPTKNHWRNDSHLEDIKAGLAYLAKHAQEWGITSLAVPPLGCGNGKLSWEDVLPLIKSYLEPLNIPVEIYAPFEDSKAAVAPPAKRARITDFLPPTNDSTHITP